MHAYLSVSHIKATNVRRLDVAYFGAPGVGELAYSVHAVVGVGAKHVGTAGGEGERFPDELERAGGVGGEHDGVAWWRPEEGEDGLPCLVSACCGQSGSV